MAVFLLNVRRTAFGRALAAVREKDYAAAVLGVNTFYFKLMAFWVSSMLGGMAGALLAFCYYRAVTPEQFHLDVSIQLLAMVIVGGLAQRHRQLPRRRTGVFRAHRPEQRRGRACRMA